MYSWYFHLCPLQPAWQEPLQPASNAEQTLQVDPLAQIAGEAVLRALVLCYVLEVAGGLGQQVAERS
jgi:hypothetical protein